MSCIGHVLNMRKLGVPMPCWNELCHGNCVHCVHLYIKVLYIWNIIEIIGSHFKIKAYVTTVFGMLWWKNKWSLIRSVNYVTSVYKWSMYALQTQKFSAVPLVPQFHRTACNEPFIINSVTVNYVTPRKQHDVTLQNNQSYIFPYISLYSGMYIISNII